MNVQSIIDKTVTALNEAPGVVGVVLGGSRARGTNRPDSDIDIGIYYDSAYPLDLVHMGSIATRLDDTRRENIIAPPGGWWWTAIMWTLFSGTFAGSRR